MNRKIKALLAVLLGLVFMSNAYVISAAEATAAIVEKYIVEDDAILYVDGVKGEVKEISFQIGNTVCEISQYSALNNTDENISTLILWDNSLSVMKNYSTSIKDILQDIENVKMSSKKIKFLGEERTALFTESEVMGVKYYILQIYEYSFGEYAAIVTFSTFIEDKTEELAGMFYKFE